MKEYKETYSTKKPLDIEVTETQVLIAKNIQKTSITIEDSIKEVYIYDLIIYNKDEYLIQQQQNINELQEELQATKIILGVE